MDNDMLISVIIPAYNAERFLDRAVKSVLCQMDGNIELILVNDGSADNTGAICDQYAAQYPNVRVIHKENGGISSARNAGIAASRGAYLTFLDSDDYWEQDCCEEVCKVIRQYFPDVIDFGWRYVTNGTAMPPAFHKLPKNILLDAQVIKETILPPLLNLRNDPDHFIFDFACMKVFKAEIMHSNCVRFDEKRRVWEDRPFLVQFLKYSKSYYSIDRCFYNYVDTPNSLGRRYSVDFFRIILENFRQYRDLCGADYDFDTDYVNGHWSRAIEKMLLRSLEETENRAQIEQNMMDTLVDEQVVHWFRNRIPANDFEKKTSELIASGEAEGALKVYRKKSSKQQKEKHRKQVWMMIRGLVRKALKG